MPQLETAEINRCVNNNNQDKNHNINNVDKDDNNHKDIKYIIYVALIRPEKERASHVVLYLGWCFDG